MISYESLGLTTKEQRAALRETLVSSHSLRIDILVLDLEGAKVGDLSDRLIDGQVNIDVEADVTRSAELSLLDPNGSISFESDSPADAAMYLDRMIQIRYCVKGELLDDWVEIPVFTGPIVALGRDEDTVSVTCHGKEELAMGDAWQVFNRPKGAYVVDVIRDVLRHRAGETLFDFPRGMRDRLDKPFSMSKESVPWLAAKKLAESVDRQLYYDGAGRAKLRPQDLHNPQWTFTDGDSGSLLTEPELSFTTEDLKNVVVVTGGAPKGEKKKVTATSMPVNAHPLSPVSLGRNGVGRYLVHRVTNGQIRSKAKAERVANNHLARLLRQEVEAAFECVPVPLLEEGDCVAVETGGVSVEFNANQFTIPLTAGASMNMGFLDRNSFDSNRFRTTSWAPKKKRKKKKARKRAKNRRRRKNKK